MKTRPSQSCRQAWRIVLLGALLGGAGLAEEEIPHPWSLRPVSDPKVPAQAEGWGRNAVDAFLAQGFKARDLAPAPAAPRRVLIRRAAYDLTGLPPERALVEAFVDDARPDGEAFAVVVEKLLSSPHYGERWGRHWLDVVRYADTAGENSDHPLPHAWRYRNWVIDAFNDDKPYDQFVRDQIAGDLIHADGTAAERNAGIVATGYLAISRRFGHDIDKSTHLMFEDSIDNLGKAFLGLSISCARCHEHKHDPIAMRDYYSLYAVIDSTTFSFPGCEPKQQPRDLIPLASADHLAAREAWEKRRDELNAQKKTGARPAKAAALKDLAASCGRVLSKGQVAEGKGVHVTEKPLALEVRKGEAIQLSILPNGGHGADTTTVEFSVTHGSGEQSTTWSVHDLLDDLLAGNPHPAAMGASWCFLDTAGSEPAMLDNRRGELDGKKELKAWTGVGGLPSVTVNTARSPVNVWTSLPPRTFFCHPSARGAVAIAWTSPVDGEVRVHLKVSDGHPAGGLDGVGWRLEHFADPGMAAAYRELGEAMVPRLELEKEIAEHAAREPDAPPVAYAVREGKPVPARVHERGDPELTGEEYAPEFLAALGGGSLGGTGGSGRRELAVRIASPANPLFARVMVNRIWAWHFGRGLVATPNDFGNHGAAPSHPDLLDYLARYFMDHGWSVKAMHRLIMNSATYQRAAGEGGPTESFAAFARRRITAEELRDTLLVAAGKLDRRPGGAHPFPPEKSWNFTQHNPFAAEYPTDKRSVYVMRKRNRSSRFFALFNGADPNASTAIRDVTSAPTQALFFMNASVFHESAKHFADRIRKAASGSAARLDFACRELFARPAEVSEVAAFEEFAAALGATLQGDAEAKDAEIWRAYARVLLASNELLHVD